jgi:hypothetical protein
LEKPPTAYACRHTYKFAPKSQLQIVFAGDSPFLAIQLLYAAPKTQTTYNIKSSKHADM